MTRGDRASARAHLERIQREHPTGPMSTRASVMLAQLAFGDGDVAAGCAAVAAARESLTAADVELRNQLDYYGPRCANLAATVLRATRRPTPAQPRLATSEYRGTSTRRHGRSTAFRWRRTTLARRQTRSPSGCRLAGTTCASSATTKPFRVRVGRYPTRERAADAVRQMAQAQRAWHHRRGGAAVSREATPLMQQYREIKSRHQDAILLFRMGDFYEMFYDDAEIASRHLGLTLTARNNGGAAEVPLAGVPVKAVGEYLRRLVQQGFRVAICEQVEDPKLAKGIVRREVVETVTPGAAFSDDLLDGARNNFLCAVHAIGDAVGIAAADVSTGEFRLTLVRGVRCAGHARPILTA